MKKHLGFLRGLGFAALMGLLGSQAEAGTLTVILTWDNGAQTLTITGGPNATLSTTGGVESLTFNTGTLNGYLASHGSNLTFAAGSGVSTNQPSATQSSGATLTSTGQLNLTGTSGVAGADSMTIRAYLTDFGTPSGPVGTLSSSASANFTNTNIGDTQSFQSWYNNNNAANGTVLPSGTVTQTSYNTTNNPGTQVPPSGIRTAAISAFATPFSLTNEISISLSPSGKSGESGQYVGSTLVTAVPEPASLVMMLTGMPVPFVVLGLLRRRKAAAKA